MSGFFQGLWILLGVIIGIVIELSVKWINRRCDEKQTLKNLKFEFEVDIKKIDKWLEEISRYRNAVNLNAMHTWFGYFDLSRFIYPTANAMFLNGLLYKYLTKEEIGKLLVICSEFSLAWEVFLNNQIKENRTNFDQPRVGQEINMWETKFRDHKQTLEDILRRLN